MELTAGSWRSPVEPRIARSYRTLAAEILRKWRAPDRVLAASSGAEVQAADRLELDRLGRAYHEVDAMELRIGMVFLPVLDEAHAAPMPEPPPFPATGGSEPG